MRVTADACVEVVGREGKNFKVLAASVLKPFVKSIPPTALQDRNALQL